MAEQMFHSMKLKFEKYFRLKEKIYANVQHSSHDQRAP